MMKAILTLLIFIFLVRTGNASSASPLSYVVQGWNSECFFLMRSSFEGEKFFGIGTCYQIKDDGSFEKMWQFKGGYSFEGRIFLGEQGKVLVRIVEVIQPQPDPDKAKLSEQTTLEFCREGKIFKIIRVRDVVDPQKLVTSGEFVGVFATHQIFNYNNATAPKMGRLLDYDFFDDEDKETMRKIITDETEIFCIRTVQAEILVFKVLDGSLIHRKKLK